MEVNFLRLKDERIALFYCQKNTESTDCRVMMRTSSDEGKTWKDPKQLSPAGKYTGLTNGRSIRLTTRPGTPRSVGRAGTATATSRTTRAKPGVNRSA